MAKTNAHGSIVVRPAIECPLGVISGHLQCTGHVRFTPRKQILQSRFDNSAKYAWKFKAGTVADAVAFESVSTAEFPANREKNREFFNFGPDSGLEHPMRPIISRAFEQIPYVTEQGIISAEQGILPQEQGIFSVKSEITPE